MCMKKFNDMIETLQSYLGLFFLFWSINGLCEVKESQPQNAE